MVVELGDLKGYLADDDRSCTWGKTPGDDAWRSWCGLGVQVVDLAGLDGPTQNNTRASGCQQQGGDGGGQQQEMVSSLSGGRPAGRWLGLVAEAAHAYGCAGARSTLEANEAEEVGRAEGARDRAPLDLEHGCGRGTEVGRAES